MTNGNKLYNYDRYTIDTAWVLNHQINDLNRYKIETYGCQMNAHESEKLAYMLENMGYSETDNIEEANLIIFNTCCVREHAELKIHGNVGALRKRKEDDPSLIVVVCGCMMQQKNVAEELTRKYPFIDIVFGTHNFHAFPSFLRRSLEGEKVRDIWDKNEGLEGSNIPALRKGGVSAFVNIIYGCNNFCSYCIVPYVRGRERSRPHKEILSEILSASNAGYSEIILLGQNVNSYGNDSADELDFPSLLEEISRIESVSRIRFMTSHPKDLSNRLIEVMANNPKVCSQLHLPVQSGSNTILHRMNRGYTREDYLNLVDRLRDNIGIQLGLTTDLIVGFPGETDRCFYDTLTLVDDVKFHAAYMFMYSPRKGTAAANYSDQINQDIKKERLYQLIDLQNRITDNIHQGLIGHEETVLVESISKRNSEAVSGRTDSGRMVTFPGEKDLIGKMINIRITHANANTLSGEQIK